MKIFHPSYYKDFKCIADRCRHSCCVGWEIGVDDNTIKKYASLPEVEKEEVLSNIDKDGCVILTDDERCPFLCDSGLCRLISTYGDEYISHICREHPRFYHRVGDRVECGIGASCEEAARIILSSDGFADFVLLERDVEIAEETDFDTLSHRDILYSILKTNNYIDATKIIAAKYSLPDHFAMVEKWNELLSELEYLDEDHRLLIKLSGREERKSMQEYTKRFLAYLIFRHVSVAKHYDGLRASIGFCLLLAGIMEGMLCTLPSKLQLASECARVISEEIEYSEDNTSALIFELECLI